MQWLVKALILISSLPQFLPIFVAKCVFFLCKYAYFSQSTSLRTSYTSTNNSIHHTKLSMILSMTALERSYHTKDELSQMIPPGACGQRAKYSHLVTSLPKLKANHVSFIECKICTQQPKMNRLVIFIECAI